MSVSYKNIIIFICFFVVCFTAHSQKTAITGKIVDKITGEPIPYVNVVFENTNIGTTSQVNGSFILETYEPVTKLQIMSVGYKPQHIPLDSLPGRTNITIRLEEDVIAIGEITVTPGENPAHPILKKISENKKYNNPDNFADWTSNLYSKIEIDLKNIKKKERDGKLWNQIDFIYDYIDTLDTSDRTFLPVFITETSSDYYHYNDGTTHEHIKATKISGVTSNMITEFTGKLYTDINPYNNFFNLDNTGLVSPINDQGLLYYRYYLRDSTIVNGDKIYEISFYPRAKQTPTFKGVLWVADSTFALTRIEMRLSETANINFLKEVVFEKTYKKLGNRYIHDKESFWVDFDLQKRDNSKLVGLIGRKTIGYDNFAFHQPADMPKKPGKEITVAKDAQEFDAEYWNNIRPMALNEREEAIYGMVDSLKNVPVIKTTIDYVQMFLFGYKELGWFELGPYFYIYSNNRIEGARLRLGGRTTLKFHEKLRLNAYTAYGFRDNKFKYGGGFEYFFKKDKRFSIEGQYKHDYELLGKSDNAFNADNILTGLVSKRRLAKLNMIDQAYFQIDKEWSVAFSNSLRFSTSRIHAGKYVPFNDISNNPVNDIRTSEISLNTRFSPKEKTVLGNYIKKSLGGPLPIVNFKVTAGLKDVFSSDYSYLKLHADIYDKLPLPPIGHLVYTLQGGYIFGDMPFPLMKIHEGNETYAYNPMAFNLMNYHEFVSDRYASLSLEHHFQGFFLNRIPLLRKLQFREVVGAKCLISDFNPDRHNQLLFPTDTHSLNREPYIEVSAGIENILKFLRVDAVWRLTETQLADVDKFMLFFSLQVIF